MPKPPSQLPQLSADDKLRILDAQITTSIQIIQRLAEGIEANANRMSREPTRSEEAAVNIQRRRLRKYLLRRQALSCAMHTNQEKEQA